MNCETCIEAVVIEDSLFTLQEKKAEVNTI